MVMSARVDEYSVTCQSVFWLRCGIYLCRLQRYAVHRWLWIFSTSDSQYLNQNKQERYCNHKSYLV